MKAKWAVTVLTLTMASLAALAVPAFADGPYTVSYFSYPGARSTRAWDINDAGQIVGSYEDAGLRSHAFLYENGSFATIDYPGAYGTYATGINNAGQIVGWADMNPAWQSFLYEAGSFTAVAFPAYTIPYGINDAGQIVGQTGYGVYHHGFLYDGSFSVLDFPGASVTAVFGNNDAGQAVGFFSMGIGSYGFLYDSGSFTTVSYPGYAGASGPYDINDAGQLVGTACGGYPSGCLAWVYDGENYQYLVGGQLYYAVATGINNAGQIVGHGSCSTYPCASFLAQPRDAAPPILACPDGLVLEADPGRCSAVVTYTVTATDDTGSQPTISCDSPSGSDLPVGETAVTCVATDHGGASSSCSFTVTVSDQAPPVISLAGANPASVECTATFSDPGATAIDACAGSVAVTASGSVNVGVPGSYPITYSASDGASTATATRIVTVADTTPPVLVCPAGTGAGVGESCRAVLFDILAGVAVSDSCAGSVILTQTPGAGTSLGMGTHTITLAAVDDAGNSSSCVTAFTAVNAPPVIHSLTGPSGPLVEGAPAMVSASFTDAGGQGHNAVFSWGDGSPDTSVELPPGLSTVAAARTYAGAGVYAVTVTVLDDCGQGSSAVFEFIVVYDPSAGFVTGGGWIASPGEACPVLCSGATGRANFGFVSKYLRGAQVPTGQTEFQFRAGDLNFHSTSYEWLVVAGARAQFKGAGGINGAGDYQFLLTAIDGQVNGGGGVDRFRIKIWVRETGEVVYDNKRGSADGADPQTLGGGSVVIHTQ